MDNDEETVYYGNFEFRWFKETQTLMKKVVLGVKALLELN